MNTAIAEHPATVAQTSPPAPEDLCLPSGYRQQPQNLTHDANRAGESYWSDWRIAQSGRYQYHVYRWAARLLQRFEHPRVLDVGCGVATKLQQHIAPLGARITGLDQPAAVATCRRLERTGEFIEINLERPQVNLADPFDLVICADVLEHLQDPAPAMNLIRQAAGPAGRVLLSTPDRRRRRGRRCMQSDKPEHVREWSHAEFLRFVRRCGFSIHASRLYPQDDSAVREHRAGELAFRLRLRGRSGLACHTVLCRPS